MRMTDRLPAKSQAYELFEHFVNNVDCHYRLLHVPTARASLDKCYREVTAGYEPHHTSLMLLFSIFASSVFFWFDDHGQAVPSAPKYSKTASVLYGRTAIALFEKVRATTPISIAVLQALGILSHLFINSEGFSDAFQLLRNSGLVMAQSLRIHQLDTPKRCRERAQKPVDMVEIETQRRIWWHVVSSDW